MIHSKANALKTTAELLADMAVDARATAHSAQTGHSGLIYVENEDGTATVIGSGDATIATHVGDTTPPPVPTGIAATSVDGTVAVTWDGTLEGETPADFLRVNLYVGGVWFAALAEAGSALTPPQEVGATVEVTATSEDDACEWDGTPAHNVSEPCAPVAVEVRDLFAEGRAEMDEARADLAAAKAEAEGAAQAAADAKAAADAAGDAADAALAKGDEVAADADAAVAGVRAEVGALRETVPTKVEVTQAVDAAKGEVLQSVAAGYVDKATGATLATKSEVTQTADAIRSEVEQGYVSAETGATLATKSELTQTATAIRSEVTEVSEAADAAMAKATSVEQTAEGISARVTQTATKADQTAAKVAELTVTVDGIESSVATAQETADAAVTAASHAQQTVDGFKSTVEKTYLTKGDAGKTYATQSSLTQTADAIRSEVSEGYVDKATGETLATKSEVTQAAGSIRLEVSQTYTAKADAVTATKLQFYLSTSQTALQGGSWSDSAPAPAQGRYIWQRSVDTKGDGTTVTGPAVCVTGNTGATGAAGKGATAVMEEWYLSTSATAQSGGSWSAAQPALAAGRYLWNRQKITWTDGTTTYTTPQRYNAVDGIKGELDSFKSDAATTYATKASLTTTADSIRSEVSRDYATKASTATLAEKSYVDQRADSITSTVSQTYVTKDAAKAYATKTEVKQTTDAIRLTAEESLRKVDNLKIGGTNLLIDSGTLPLTLLRPGDDTPGYGNNNLLAATGVGAGYRGNNRVDTNKAWAGLSLNLRKNAEGRIKVGDEVTLSIRVMVDNDATGLRFGLYRVTNIHTDVTLKSDIPGATNRGSRTINAPLLKGGVWYTLWGTFTVEESLLSPGNSGQRFEQAVDTSYPVHWSSPKLEMGSTPTDWSACPLDIVDSMMETGVNRATGSKDFTAMCKPIPPANGATLSVIDSGSVPGHKSVNYTVPTSGVYDPIAVIPHGVMRVPKKGDTVTVSFNAYAKDGGRIQCCAYSDKNDGTNCKKQTVNSEGYRINTSSASDGSNSFDLPANENKRCWYTVTYLEDAQRCPSLIIGRVNAASSKRTTYAIDSIKVEFGDVATPWSPAPEDADIKFSTKAELKVQTDRITGVVTEQAGLAGRMSTVEQKADGLTVTLGEVADDASSALSAAEAAADMAQSAATNSADAIAQTNAAVAANTSVLDSFSVDELNQVLARVRVVQAGGVPALQLGSTTSGLWAQLTNSQLSFMDASTVVAYISAMKLFISQAQVTGQLGIGGFAWVPRANGNLCLKKV